jgi:hypothetical protein
MTQTISNMKTGHIYSERIFGPDLVLHQARQTLRELIKLTGLYTKVRPHVHLSLNKHGRPKLINSSKLTQRTNIIKMIRRNYYRYNRIKAKINPWVRMLVLGFKKIIIFRSLLPKLKFDVNAIKLKCTCNCNIFELDSSWFHWWSLLCQGHCLVVKVYSILNWA